MILSSGSGGDGGVGGVAGAGGKGAKGASVILHTNDPTIFTMLYVDVSEGEGGVAGTHGVSGPAGVAGNGGGFGGAGSWQIAIPGPQGPVYNEQRGRPGRAGKNGKKGKAGKPPTSKASKNGSDGEVGRISICLYDNNGLSESAGTPYRITLDKKKIQKLLPCPVIYKVPTKMATDPFIYGQLLEFGPTMPINLGGLSSPDSNLLASLFLNFNIQKVAQTRLSFPTIPGEKDTKYGELPPSNMQKVVLQIPELKNSGFFIDENFWPWPVIPSAPPLANAIFKIEFEVDKICMRPSKEDGENAGVKEYPVKVDIPVELVVPTVGLPVRCPSSIAISATETPSEIIASFTVRNKLACTKLASGHCTFTFRVASLRFRPLLKALNGTQVEIRSLSQIASEQGFLKIKATGFVNELQPNQSEEIHFKLCLPKNEHGNLVEPGAQIILRAELAHQSYMAFISVPSVVRVAAPLPPTANVGPWDVMVFSTYSMVVEDYRAIQQIYGMLGMRVYFLDIDHFRDPETGRVPRKYWQSQFGRATLVWLPQSPGQAKLIPSEDLYAHVRSGGGLIYGAAATFQWLDPASSKTPAARRAVKLDGAVVSLNTIRLDASFLPNKLNGKGVRILTAATIAVLSTGEKLQYLKDKHALLESLQVGDLNQTVYSSQLESGCCGGGKVKVMPLSKSPCRMLDLVLTAIRTDVTIDTKIFASTMSFQDCVAINSIVSFCREKLRVSASPSNGNFDMPTCCVARDVVAAACAANVMDDNLLTGKPGKAWKKDRAAMLSTLRSCINLCTNRNMDYQVVARRVQEMDIIPGFSVINRGIFGGVDAVNFSGNTITYAAKF